MAPYGDGMKWITEAKRTVPPPIAKSIKLGALEPDCLKSVTECLDVGSVYSLNVFRFDSTGSCGIPAFKWTDPLTCDRSSLASK
jgi:hypothetical protein